MRFVEDNSGIRDVVISLQFVNFSRYPVTARVEFETSEFANIERTTSGLSSNDDVSLTAYSTDETTKEITITYHATTDSGNLNANIGMTIIFLIKK